MKTLIQKLTPAIIDSRKIKVQFADGHKLVVHPHIVIRKKEGDEVFNKEGDEILKSMLDNGDCLDIPFQKIAGISIMPDGFAIDSTCLHFNYEEYELVFPKREDWFGGKK